jgi:demethylsterigmatocystin 6-O-methyltransferase
MCPQSILLIDEMVIPSTGASPILMRLDLTMMTLFSSTERTVPQWHKLLAGARLELNQVWKYDPDLEYSILQAIPAMN